MRATDRLLYLCARQEFLPAHREQVESLAAGAAVAWPRVISLAERHGLLPMVAANLRRCDAARLGLPQTLSDELELAILENAALRERDDHRLAASLARLREVKLEAMLLKTPALALGVYEEPWVAVARDVDLALRPLPGWVKGEGGEREVRADLYPRGIECDLDGHHDVTMNGVLPIDFERVWREARPVLFRGAPAWAMAPRDLLLALCVNACRKRYFRLKCLFDVAETLRRGERVEATRLAELAHRQRCEGIVAATLLTVRATVGSPLASDLLGALRLGPVRGRALAGLVAAAVRWGSLDSLAGRLLGALLVAASLRPADALRALLRTPRQWLRERGKRRRAPARDAAALD